MGTVSFYAKGNEFTELVRDLIRSGSFYNAIEILRDGGFKNEHVLEFLEGKLKFEGDTRKGDFEVLEDDIDSPLILGWMTYCNEEDIDYTNLNKHESSKHTESLFNIITPDGFSSKYYKELLEAENFKVHTSPPLHIIEDGVFLQTGEFVECGFQSHRYLYPHLLNLNLATCSDWMDDEKCIHVSSKNMSGKVAYSIAGDLYGRLVSEAQLDSIMAWKEHFDSFYSERRGSAINAVRKAIILREGKGAKYGNLIFLQRYYDVNLPIINKKAFKEGEFAIRTSPEKSIPGILNSKFNISTVEETNKALKEIGLDWKEAKDIRKGNILHLFYQRQVEGLNGVCHYKTKGNFTHRVGKQHEIVNGRQGDLGDIELIHNKLRPLARQLYNDLKAQIQLEFIINEDKITIVQLRTIKTPSNESAVVNKPKGLICTGKSFTKGNKIVKLENCIVVQNEIESKDVIGKEAVIVRDDVDFSHALALSQQLYIPSIYGIGDIELPDEFHLNTEHITGLISKTNTDA